MKFAYTLLLANAHALTNGSSHEILDLSGLGYRVGPDTCSTWKKYDCFNCILSNCHFEPGKGCSSMVPQEKGGITIGQFLDRAPICQDLG